MAIAVLVGLSVGILTIAIASFFFYQHYASQFPSDTQNILSALTSGVLVGIGIGAVAAVARRVVVSRPLVYTFGPLRWRPPLSG